MVAERSPVESVFDWVESLAGRWWFAEIRTGERWENRLSGELRALGADVLPLREQIRTKKPSGVTETVYRPLFSGYLFFNGSIEHRYAARTSLATIAVHDIADQRRTARELAQIALALATFPNLSKVTLSAGQRVEIIAGPLRGFTGYVIESHPNIVHLSVTTMGQAVAVEINPGMVEAV